MNAAGMLVLGLFLIWLVASGRAKAMVNAVLTGTTSGNPNAATGGGASGGGGGGFD